MQEIFHSSILNKKACAQSCPTGYTFLAASRDHGFLLSHRITYHIFHVLPLCPEGPIMITLITLIPVNYSYASVTFRPKCPMTLNIHCKEERCPARISIYNKNSITKTIQNINFVNPFKTRREHEALMHEVNREVRCIDMKYSVKIESIFCKWDKFIPTV